MHFGQFNLMGYRERGTSTKKIMMETVEQVKVAEQTGFEIAWFAEHHFSNYCVCPSPLMMAAHCAAVTDRIKLGPAVVVIPLYEPVRLLAEIGMVDALSNGRLALGIGSGYQPYEFERFAVDLAKSKEMTEEFMAMFDLAFSQETFSFNGKHYQLPETHISARPVQEKLSIWIAGDAADIHRMAARRGYIPLFTGRLFGADYLAQCRDRVAESFTAEGKDPATMPLGIQRFMCVTSSRRETMDYVENCRHQMRLASNLRRREEVMDGSMLVEQPAPDELTLEQIADNLLVGDCETIAERLSEEIKQAQPSHMMFHFQVGASDYRKALTTMEQFASEIRPLLEKELGSLEAIGNPLPAAA